jgi:hypothetical protein
MSAKHTPDLDSIGDDVAVLKRELSRLTLQPPDFALLVADLESLTQGAEDFIRENKVLVLTQASVAGLLAAGKGSRGRG